MIKKKKNVIRPVGKAKIEKPKTWLYYAYGSNLSHRNMAVRCPDARPLHGLMLRNGRLVFRGVADVIGSKKEQDLVPGGLWRITPRCERALDGYEGVANGCYAKRYFKIKLKGGGTTDVLFYQMKRETGIMPPSENYLNVIAEGYRDFDLDLSYLSEALDRAWSNKRVTEMLRLRHIRRGSPKLAKALQHHEEPQPEFEMIEFNGEEFAPYDDQNST